MTRVWVDHAAAPKELPVHPGTGIREQEKVRNERFILVQDRAQAYAEGNYFNLNALEGEEEKKTSSGPHITVV